jgi:hypothetical protein
VDTDGADGADGADGVEDADGLIFGYYSCFDS